MMYLFFKQKAYQLHPEMVLAIKMGLVYFVIFSLFGGYISNLQGHTIGANDGGEGFLFLNWSKFFGDLRIAHFFGIHSLQMIPLFAIISGKYFDTKQSIKFVTLLALIYLGFVIFTLVKGLIGLPLFHLWRVFSP